MDIILFKFTNFPLKLNNIDYDGESKYRSSLREKKPWTVSFFKNKHIEVHSGVLIVKLVAVSGKPLNLLRE
jgi:hypothetical protein